MNNNLEHIDKSVIFYWNGSRESTIYNKGIETNTIDYRNNDFSNGYIIFKNIQNNAKTFIFKGLSIKNIVGNKRILGDYQGTSNFSFYFEIRNAALYIIIATNQSDTGNNYCYTENILNANIIYDIVFVLNANSSILYINGNSILLTFSGTLPTKIRATQAPYIGQTNAFIGKLQQIIIYNRLLSVIEVKAIYKNYDYILPIDKRLIQVPISNYTFKFKKGLFKKFSLSTDNIPIFLVEFTKPFLVAFWYKGDRKTNHDIINNNINSNFRFISTISNTIECNLTGYQSGSTTVNTTLVRNKLNHILLYREPLKSETFIFINGVLGSKGYTPLYFNDNAQLYVGRPSSNDMYGLISGIYYNKGTYFNPYNVALQLYNSQKSMYGA